mmetsp:Transcript_110220/g.318555  ORF Transcript_110220/g.318555 Transcript_110220/m.318555 type:complete len:305 (+) Transcript_110220:1465-2379(+)
MEEQLRGRHQAWRVGQRPHQAGVPDADGREGQRYRPHLGLEDVHRVLGPDDGQMDDHVLAVDGRPHLRGRRLADPVHCVLAHDLAGGDGLRLALFHQGDANRLPEDLILGDLSEVPLLDVIEEVGHAATELARRPPRLAVEVHAHGVSLPRRQADDPVGVDGDLAHGDVGGGQGRGALLPDGHVEIRPEFQAVCCVLDIRQRAPQPELGLEHDPELEVLGEKHPRRRREADVHHLRGEVSRQPRFRVEMHEAFQLQLRSQAEAQRALQGPHVIRLELAAPSGLDRDRHRPNVEPQWCELLLFPR